MIILYILDFVYKFIMTILFVKLMIMIIRFYLLPMIKRTTLKDFISAIGFGCLMFTIYFGAVVIADIIKPL